MLVEDRGVLRVVDASGERTAGRTERGWAIFALVLALLDAAAAVAVLGRPVLGPAPFGIPLEVDRFVGIMGVLFLPVWIGLGAWLMRESRLRRQGWMHDYTMLALGPDEVEVEGVEAVAYNALAAVTVRGHGSEGTIALRTRSGTRIECELGNHVDDAELAQVLEVLEVRTTQFDVPFHDEWER